MEQIDYTGLVPFTPPDELEEWTVAHAPELQKDELVYKVETDGGRRVRIWCSACGEEKDAVYIPAEYVCSRYATGPGYGFRWRKESNTLHDGDTTTCPHCGKRCTVRHGGRAGHLGTAWPLTVHRIGDRIAIVWWSVSREIVRIAGGYDTRTEIRPYEAYVVEQRKLVRLKGYWRGMGYAFKWLHGWKQVKTLNDCCGTAELVYPWDCRLLEGTSAENSKLDLYLKSGADCRPVQYLNNWVKKPQAENLIVQGLGPLYNSLLEFHRNYTCQGQTKYSWKHITEIDWKQRSPAKMLGITRDELALVRRESWGARELRMLQGIKAAGLRMKEDELLACAAFGPDGVMSMIEDGLPVMKRIRYINRQRRRYPGETSRIGVSTLEDYWRLAEKAGAQLTTEAERWPQHLTAAHDAMLQRVKWKQSQELIEGFRTQYERLSVYSFRAGGLLIRPVLDESELIREGKLLHHCVATYAKSHTQGERVILLIRREEEPEKPFFTLNLNTKTLSVIQNHGLRNCAPTEEIKTFVALWLEHIQNHDERKTA